MRSKDDVVAVGIFAGEVLRIVLTDALDGLPGGVDVVQGGGGAVGVAVGHDGGACGRLDHRVGGVEGAGGRVVPAGAHVGLAGLGVGPVALEADGGWAAGAGQDLTERVVGAGIRERTEGGVGRVEGADDVAVGVTEGQALGRALRGGQQLTGRAAAIGGRAVGGRLVAHAAVAECRALAGGHPVQTVVGVTDTALADQAVERVERERFGLARGRLRRQRAASAVGVGGGPVGQQPVARVEAGGLAPRLDAVARGVPLIVGGRPTGRP
jgi:hypothetical protein